MPTRDTDVTPTWVGIDEFCQRTSLSRSGVYVAIQRGNLIARKVGKRTLLDLAAGLRWIADQPAPVIRRRSA